MPVWGLERVPVWESVQVQVPVPVWEPEQEPVQGRGRGRVMAPVVPAPEARAWSELGLVNCCDGTA